MVCHIAKTYKRQRGSDYIALGGAQMEGSYCVVPKLEGRSS